MGNAKEFIVELSDMADHIDDVAGEIISEAIINLFYTIKYRTPIDTGFAQSRWRLQLEDGSTSVPKPHNMVIDWSSGSPDIIIENDAHYIEYLENGWSQQAPSGMVAISVAEFNSYFSSVEIS